ncbi:YceD family protein [Cohnella zeiphila]|uniref:DUF177 domain-containing protein n=1 Tax=Cohnella zeiphila TaxID=2761120 RepID=A0A7X0SSX4_9BACL|nr:DUF177 domain-containing protein [Cohnella zeiphila]MBB6735526.1 DUF177 domain-containing protein [Cohnella zeiphila]
MLLNVQELAQSKEPARLEESFDASDAFASIRDAVPISPVSAKLTASYADGVIEVTGTVSCKIRLSCSRCLEPTAEELRIPFEETFKVVSKETREPSEPDDDLFVPIEGERLELRPYVLEELIVQLPLAPLCREDCKGLCPECGTNRNVAECGCSADKVDPRLEALKSWFSPE